MSEQLDWLARNVHEWPLLRGTALFVGRDHRSEGFNAKGSFEGFYPDSYSKVTKQQWLDRRAELQNKPSWKDAPKWAEWLGQCANAGWEWYEGEEVPLVHADADYWDHKSTGKYSGNTGEVLGDWRDTLEKRPYISVTGCAAVSSGYVGVTVGEPADRSEQAVTARLQEATDNAQELPLTRKQALQWTVENVKTWHKAPLGPWPTPFGWSWEQACGNIYLMQVGEPCIGEMEWVRAKREQTTSELNTMLEGSGFEQFTSLEDAQLVGMEPTLHTIHHAAFLHRGCQLLLNEPELVVFRTSDGELLHCKPKECLIDPDQYGLAARLLSDMSGCNVAPEYIQELAGQMGWAV